jgi:hypothetical protein
MAHPDLDALLNALLPFAKQQLSKRGVFLPFGASMSTDGAISLAMGYSEEQTATAQGLIALLEAGFANSASEGVVRAVGLCMDVRVVPPGETGKTDAICCSLEHASGETRNVFIPYRKGLFGRLTYGALFASPGARRAFKRSSLG